MSQRFIGKRVCFKAYTPNPNLLKTQEELKEKVANQLKPLDVEENKTVKTYKKPSKQTEVVINEVEDINPLEEPIV